MPRTLLLSLCLTGICLAQPPQAANPRLTPEEFVKLQSISQGAVSPDGQVLVYTVSSETPTDPHFTRQGGGSQSQVCLFEGGKERVLLENSCQPSWSPDGKALALLDADVNEARLKVWWRQNGTWSVLRHASIGYGGGPGYVWLANQRLLVSTRVAPPGKTDVTVLDSQAVTTQPRQALVEWNPDTGTSHEWAQGVFSNFVPSLDGQRVVALRITELSFPAVARTGPSSQLVLLDSTGHEVAFDMISNPTPESLRWSADGKQFVACDEFGHWWQASVNGVQPTPLATAVTDCCWMGNRLALRSDAWKLDEKPLLPASARFFSSPNGALALADGHVYQLDAKAEPQIVSQLPGVQPFRVERQGWPLVVRQGSQRCVINDQGQIRSLAAGSSQFFAGTEGVVWLSNPEHTQISGSDGQAGPQVASPPSTDRLQSVACETGGVDWLLMPSPDRPGPYATVVWLQPGQAYAADAPPPEALLSNQTGGLNARLLSAQGYAVYFPSLPESQGEPAAWLDKSLHAALLRMGKNSNIDLQRLAVLGQGLGGYATLMAATQSHPFKAAIALSAVGDLSSDYARLSPATRLGSAQDALPFVHRQSHYYEKGELGLGLPPWQDPQMWIRNSPYYQAGRVQMPVLLISGSRDGHVAQSEQFFTALYRQGKPARLVRYREESQRIERAEHVVDEWHQIGAWLERYLGDQSSARANAPVRGL